jgi:outer membrane receptor protein involved in Fe transport
VIHPLSSLVHTGACAGSDRLRAQRCRLKRISLGVLAALASMQATANEADDIAGVTQGSIMPVIRISAASLPPGLSVDPDRLPYTLQRAGEAARRESGATELTEFMQRRLTGVHINETQGSRLQGDLSFRGFRLSPVLGAAQGMSAFLDGVRINEAFGDVVNWDMLPQAAIADVVLASGANPLFGLNTLGGALAFTTKSGRSHPGASAELITGSHGQRRADLSYGVAGEGGAHGFAAATLMQDGGWRSFSASRLNNFFAKAGNRNSDGQWDLSLLHARSRLRGNGLLPSLGDDTLYELDRAAVYSHPDLTENRVTQLTLNARGEVAGGEMSMTAYARNSRRDGVNADASEEYSGYAEACEDGFNPDGSPRAPPSCAFDRASGAALSSASLNRSATRQQSAGVDMHFTGETNSHQFLAGLSFDTSRMRYAQESLEASFTADRGVIAAPDGDAVGSVGVHGRSRAWGLYASDTMQLATRTYATASLRFNQATVRNTISGQPTEEFSYRRLNPSVGFVQGLNNAVSVFANLADGNRVPTVIELGCADPLRPCRLPVDLQADPYLKQVLSRTVEAGIRWKASETASVLVSAYRSLNRDDILFLTAGTAQRGYFANFDRTRRQGLELSGRTVIGTGTGSVTATASYSLTNATYDADGMLFMGERNVRVSPGTPLAGVPRHMLKLSAEWKPRRSLVIGADMVAVSSMASQGNEDGLRGDASDGRAPPAADWSVRGHATFNLHADWNAGNGWEVFGKVVNLFDRRHETYGAVGRDLFPGGALLQPHVDPRDAANARFVAPGTPRSVMIGLRYKM